MTFSVELNMKYSKEPNDEKQDKEINDNDEKQDEVKDDIEEND